MKKYLKIIVLPVAVSGITAGLFYLVWNQVVYQMFIDVQQIKPLHAILVILLLEWLRATRLIK
tara:strand:- start:35 stop:223 length:189 start_codon:yes stop_codon:yes gene_type:complete